MARLTLLGFVPALANLVAAEFGLAGQLFSLQGGSAVNNAKLAWVGVTGASTYRVEQSTGNGGYQTAATVSGTTHDIYDLASGSTTNFRVTALNGNSQVDQSSVVSLIPFSPQGTYNTYDNTQVSETKLKSNLEANGVFYRYNYEAYSNGSFNRFVEQTSTNGYDFTGDKTVLTGVTLCAPANYSGSCLRQGLDYANDKRLQARTCFVPQEPFNESICDYGLGWIAVAHKDPSASTLTFDGAYRPLGHDSRDMAFFNDGNSAWLVSSTDTNTNMNIYSLSSNWTVVDSLLVQVNKAAYREAPAVVKSNGFYYLFTSRAAGWLPSQPQYISAQAMGGPWSAPVDIGNTATFSSQSGGVNTLSSGQLEMNSDRWSNNWPTKGGANRQLMLPISEGSAGFASYHHYRTVQYSDDITTKGQGIYGVQSGRILSDGKPGSSSAGSTNITVANDGIQNDPANVFVPSGVPFWYQIDLQNSHSISQIDLTTKLVQGSETFYKYNVTGSTDGQSFTLLADQTNAVDVGFSASYPTSTQEFRYVRINVQSVVNNVNGNAANWAVGINEVTVYGN